MQYFKSRQEAGQLLADKLEPHKSENCAVIALSEGGVLIGAEIAKRLHAAVYMLATQEINLPREVLPIATMSSAGTFTYNHGVSPAQLEEWTNDYRSYIDQERLKAFQKLNRVVGKDG
jgi:predicted phosphoribosyltransferase